jgi:hypothetical protein
MEEPDDSAIDEPALDDGDALDHLWGAAHEMLRAMRMLIDAADEFVESQRVESRSETRVAPPTGSRPPTQHREGRVRHIDIEAS